MTLNLTHWAFKSSYEAKKVMHMLNLHHFRSPSDIYKRFIQTFLWLNYIHKCCVKSSAVHTEKRFQSSSFLAPHNNWIWLVVSSSLMTTEPKCETDSRFCEQLWLSHIYMCERVKDSDLLTGVNFCIIWIFDWIWKKIAHSELRRHASEVRV